MRSRDQPDISPAFSAYGATRGGEYISEILPSAVVSKAAPTFKDRISVSILSASSSAGVSAALLRPCAERSEEASEVRALAPCAERSEETTEVRALAVLVLELELEVVAAVSGSCPPSVK